MLLQMLLTENKIKVIVFNLVATNFNIYNASLLVVISLHSTLSTKAYLT